MWGLFVVRHSVKTSDWRNFIVPLIDGVSAHLPQTAPEEIRTALHAFKEQAGIARTKASKNRCERELESYLQGTSLLRTAAIQSLEPKVEAAVEAAIKALARAEHALNQIKKNA